MNASRAICHEAGEGTKPFATNIGSEKLEAERQCKGSSRSCLVLGRDPDGCRSSSVPEVRN